jgi:hypothetical protein
MKSNDEKALKAWLQAYRDSVGLPADECLQLFECLQQNGLANGEYISLLRELLDIMS